MKRGYKITPVSLYDVRGLESWLEDMARRGLFLKKLRPTLSTFERGPARPARYRAEPCKRAMDEEPPQAMLDLYQDFGWDFACGTPELLIFSTDDPDAPEPHSDPELQSGLWKKLYRSKRRLFLFELVLFLISAVGAPCFLFGEGTPVLALLTTSVPVLLAYLPFFLIVICREWADLRRLALIAQQLEEGVPLDHRSVYPRWRWGEVIILAVAILLLAALIVAQNILPLTGGGARSLEELTAFTPLSLAELEGEGYKADAFVIDGIDYTNFFAVEHYLLCPNRWEVAQGGKQGPDDHVSLCIWRYDLPGWLDRLSAPLAQELLEKHMDPMNLLHWSRRGIDPVWTVEYFNNYDVDFLAVAHQRDGMYHLAAAAFQDKVVLVQYTGQSDLSAPKIRKAIVGMVG